MTSAKTPTLYQPWPSLSTARPPLVPIRAIHGHEGLGQLLRHRRDLGVLGAHGRLGEEPTGAELPAEPLPELLAEDLNGDVDGAESADVDVEE